MCSLNFDASSVSKKARDNVEGRKEPGLLNASPLVTDAKPGRVDSDAREDRSRGDHLFGWCRPRLNNYYYNCEIN
jgi:hypothetical protein